jgi:hypothetical protein
MSVIPGAGHVSPDEGIIDAQGEPTKYYCRIFSVLDLISRVKPPFSNWPSAPVQPPRYSPCTFPVHSLEKWLRYILFGGGGESKNPATAYVKRLLGLRSDYATA